MSNFEPDANLFVIWQYSQNISSLGTNHRAKRIQNLNDISSNEPPLIPEPIKLAHIHNNMHNSSISRIDDITYNGSYFKNDISHPTNIDYNLTSSNYRCEYAKLGEIYCSSELWAKWKSSQMNTPYMQNR